MTTIITHLLAFSLGMVSAVIIMRLLSADEEMRTYPDPEYQDDTEKWNRAKEALNPAIIIGVCCRDLNGYLLKKSNDTWGGP